MFYDELPDGFLEDYNVMKECFREVSSDLEVVSQDITIEEDVPREFATMMQEIIDASTLSFRGGHHVFLINPEELSSDSDESTYHFYYGFDLKDAEGIKKIVGFDTILCGYSPSGLLLVQVEDAIQMDNVRVNLLNSIQWKPLLNEAVNRALVGVRGDMIVCLFGEDCIRYEQIKRGIEATGWDDIIELERVR